MPQFDSDPILEIQYNGETTGQEYDYSGLSLLDSIQDSAQLDVRWSTTYVYTASNNGGTQIPVSQLTEAAQQSIYSLDLDTQFTVNADTKLVTLDTAQIINQPVVADGATYYYPNAFAVTPAQNVTIRRSTDITARSVDFQPGSRLTAELLNTSNTQLFNAVQELTQFGTSSVVGGNADLSTSSVNDLGDVNMTVTGLAFWDNSTQQLTSGGAAGGTLVPDPTAAADGMALLKNVPALSGNEITWQYITYGDVRNPQNTNTSLSTFISDTANDILDLELKTAGFTRDAINSATEFTDALEGIDATFTGTITAADVTVSNDVTVTGDATIGGQTFSGLKQETIDRYVLYTTANTSIQTDYVSGAGMRNLFASGDLESAGAGYGIGGSAEGIASFDQDVSRRTSQGTNGEEAYIVIPRDMTVRFNVEGMSRPDPDQNTYKYYGGGFVAPYLNVDWNLLDLSGDPGDEGGPFGYESIGGYAVGNALYDYKYNNYTQVDPSTGSPIVSSSATKWYDFQILSREWIFNVEQGDKLSLLFWKWGSGDTNFANAQWRYGAWSLEEYYDDSKISFTTVAPSDR